MVKKHLNILNTCVGAGEMVQQASTCLRFDPQQPTWSPELDRSKVFALVVWPNENKNKQKKNTCLGSKLI